MILGSSQQLLITLEQNFGSVGGYSHQEEGTKILKQCITSSMDLETKRSYFALLSTNLTLEKWKNMSQIIYDFSKNKILDFSIAANVPVSGSESYAY